MFECACVYGWSLHITHTCEGSGLISEIIHPPDSLRQGHSIKPRVHRYCWFPLPGLGNINSQLSLRISLYLISLLKITAPVCCGIAFFCITCLWVSRLLLTKDVVSVFHKAPNCICLFLAFNSLDTYQAVAASFMQRRTDASFSTLRYFRFEP